MKKALLLAATALLSASAAFAQGDATTAYVKRAPITSATQLKSGMYVLDCHLLDGGAWYEGSMRAGSQDGNVASYVNNTYVDETGVNDNLYIWNLEVAEDGTFTIQNFGDSRFFSVKGQLGTNDLSYSAKNNVKYVGYTGYTGDAIQTKAIFELTPVDGNSSRFYFHLTNAQFSNNNTASGTPGNPIVGYPNLYANGSTTRQLAYWGKGEAGGVEFEICPVEEAQSIDVTINFPEWSGNDIDQTIQAIEGQNITAYVNALVQGFGGMTIKGITSDGDDETNLIVSQTNNSFTVDGDWNNDFEAGQVFRICVNPSDYPAALRYMLAEGSIKTKLDASSEDRKASLEERIIPERLWFFLPVEGEPNTYTMHTLYDSFEDVAEDAEFPAKGVYYDNNNNGTHAELSTTWTKFNLVSKSGTNEFMLKVAGTDNTYVNDFNKDGYLSLYTTTTADGDAGCTLVMYPLTASDMTTLNLPTDTDPTVDQVKVAVEAWNAQNIAAALRRIEYYCGENMIGNNPGQMNNDQNNFPEIIASAKALLDDETAEASDIEQAVKDLSYTNLSYNDVVPGRFYRFRNKLSDKYMSSITTVLSGQQNKPYMEMVTSDMANRSNTVFYYMEEGGKKMLVSFDTGLVLGGFTGASRDTWIPVVLNDAEGNQNPLASTSYNIQYYDFGACPIHASGTGNGSDHRHIYGGCNVGGWGSTVNAGGNSYDDGYLWYVEMVEELPVPLYNAASETTAWASVYSPVPLEIQNGEAVAHIGKFTGSTVEKTQHGDGTVVPANTPVLLDYKGDAEDSDRREGISYIYLKPIYDSVPSEALLYDGAEETASTSVDLNGGFLAVAKNSDTKYFTLHETNKNNFRLYEDTDYVPGFKAHVALTQDQVNALELDENQKPILPIVDPKTVGIDNIEAENAGVKAVYDLQGRKLAAPVKGINIVNGKKVLVK